jgi:hypothetical protein
MSADSLPDNCVVWGFSSAYIGELDKMQIAQSTTVAGIPNIL